MSIFHNVPSRLDPPSLAQLRQTLYELIVLLTPWVVVLLLLR